MSTKCRCHDDRDVAAERDHDQEDFNWTGFEGYQWTNEWFVDQRGPYLTTMIAETEQLDRPTADMIAFFEKRTKDHINRVIKYMKMLESFEGLRRDELVARGLQHDQDKYTDRDLVIPYIWVTEYHRVSNEDGSVPDDLQRQYELAGQATEQHVHQNLHHPEAHDDPTDMDLLDLVEMVADWSAMAEELSRGSCREWADENIGSKWRFSKDQVDIIYRAINWIENKGSTRTSSMRKPRNASNVLKYKGHLYRAAVEPTWIQRLKSGVDPETKTHHKHLLSDIKEMRVLLERFFQNHGSVVFDEEHMQLLSQLKQLLATYEYPINLVETKQSDDDFLLDLLE